MLCYAGFVERRSPGSAGRYAVRAGTVAGTVWYGGDVIHGGIHEIENAPKREGLSGWIFLRWEGAAAWPVCSAVVLN